MQNIACTARVFTGDLPDKRRRLFDFWCIGIYLDQTHKTKNSFGLTYDCLSSTILIFIIDAETSCSMCGTSHPFKSRLWDDDFCGQKVASFVEFTVIVQITHVSDWSFTSPLW